MRGTNRGGGARRVTARWALAVVGLVALLLLGALGDPAAADHAIGGRWADQDVPFGDNVAGGWDGTLRRAARDWSRSRVLDAEVVRGGADSSTCRPTPGRVEVCNGRYGRTGWLGLTRLAILDGTILRATVKINDTYFDTPQYADPVARRHTVCHELGHALGLDHVGGDSCMNHSRRAALAHVAPNAHDYEQLEALYGGNAGRRSAVTEAEQAAFGGAELDPPDPTGPERGGSSVFVTDLGGGRAVVTHVDWADAAAPPGSAGHR